MEIETLIINGGRHGIDVTIKDCEGFTVQENMGPADIPEYADNLMDSLRKTFVYLEMSEKDIIATLEDSQILTKG